MKKSLIKVVFILIAIVFAISMVGCKYTEDTTSSLVTEDVVSIEETTSFISSEEESYEEEAASSSEPVTTMNAPETTTTQVETVHEEEEEVTVSPDLSEEDISEMIENEEGPVYTTDDLDNNRENWESLGSVYVTGYVWTGNPCANGQYPTSGYTVACNDLPLGTLVYIEGIGYRVVEDRGGMTPGVYWMDVFFDSVQECYDATGYYDAWIVK